MFVNVQTGTIVLAFINQQVKINIESDFCKLLFLYNSSWNYIDSLKPIKS